MRFLRIGWLVVLAGVGGGAAAQPTNLEAYQALALRCLAEAPGAARGFRLAAPAQMPYLRTALLDRWRADGRTVFLADSAAAPAGLPRLRYEIEEVGVAYERAGRRRLARTVTLGLRYDLVGADGEVLADDRCRHEHADVIRRAEQGALETAAFPETQADAPGGGFRQRYLEPAFLAAATAVAVFLFFNLRSERTNDSA